MSNAAKHRKNNRSRLSRERPKHPLEKSKSSVWHWISWLSPTGVFVVGIVSVLALVGAYYAFYPKLSITSSAVLDPTNPWSAKFEVRNDGLLRIYAVRPVGRVRVIVLEGGATLKFNGNFLTSDPPIPYLDPGESTSITFPAMYRLPAIKIISPIAYTDIDLVIFYRPRSFFFELKKSMRFATDKMTDGTLRWFPKSSSE